LIQYGITLRGGGQLTMSDSTGNVIIGTASGVTLTNVHNTIAGAGQLGAGQLLWSMEAQSSPRVRTPS